MDDNTLLEYIHRIGRIECSDTDCRACQEHRKDALALIAKYRADARAEALREAGNRAVEYVFFEGDNDPVDENGFNAPMISSDGLRAAIANAEKPPCA